MQCAWQAGSSSWPCLCTCWACCALPLSPLQATAADSCRCSCCRFCWLLTSLLLLRRGDVLATFGCVNCESLQPWLEQAADPQLLQQQQQHPRLQWIMAQLKLTQQQQVRRGWCQTHVAIAVALGCSAIALLLRMRQHQSVC
jgi:hypothetical protein